MRMIKVLSVVSGLFIGRIWRCMNRRTPQQGASRRVSCDHMRTINQKRARALARADLRRAVLRKPLKLISSHSIFFDLTCSLVTSNLSHPTWSTRAHVQPGMAVAVDPLSCTDRNSATPPIPFLLYFSYNASSYGSLILDWQDTRDTCAWGKRGSAVQYARVNR